MPSTTFKIFRYQPDAADPEPYYQDFTLEHGEKLTLLDAILNIQNEQDGTIAVRYSCRSAICGSCACKADGRTVLACMQQVEELKEWSGGDTVQVDPIGNFEPIKDLVVDMTPFWEKVKSVKPYLLADGPPPEKERIVPKEAMQRLVKETNCILCAACYSECNSLAADPDFVGPAALAWGYRFAGDIRDGQHKERAKMYTGKHGIWACTRCQYCNQRCPKGVDPRDAIEKLGAISFREGRGMKDAGGRHAVGFLWSVKTGGKLNEILLAGVTDPVRMSLDVPFSARMLQKGKVPGPLPHRVKNLDQVKKLVKNVKETI